jgi:ApaG protein
VHSDLSLPGSIGVVGATLSVAIARDDRQARVTREARIGPGLLTQHELAAAGARDDARMPARGAQSARLGLPGIGPIVHDGSMFTSEAVTNGIRVAVISEYAPDRSNPAAQEWFFLYTITITNEGRETVQLLSRHWIITHETGNIEEVKGTGVIGEYPTLSPGESFTYTSACQLPTATGTMKGTYQMVDRSGQSFDVTIAAFTLSAPYTVH